MYVGVRSPGGFAIELSRIPYAKYEPPANGITPNIAQQNTPCNVHSEILIILLVYLQPKFLQ